MTRASQIRPVFTDRIPKELDEGVLYISEKFSTAAHACCCGCGTKIVTPLKPGRWALIRKGERVSISPSIGNWSSACQSHYVIKESRINWALGFSPAQIAANRAHDRDISAIAHAERRVQERNFWERMKAIFRKLVAFVRGKR